MVDVLLASKLMKNEVLEKLLKKQGYSMVIFGTLEVLSWP